jgi:tRNA A-37 threonylcarbamoyl transferase component Bud32
MIGNTIGSYKVTEKIGEGGMGSVYKGVDLMLEREVAIKALRPELARQPDIVERFRAEAVTLAKLNHPNIATLFSFLRQGDDFFMVMEFVRGETLDSALRRSGGMSVERAVPLFCQALEGIDHAHRFGIIHRDIKPANMMLTETSALAPGSIKVMDFGIARVLGSARMTRQGNVIGTVEYMSPEQVRGQETDARSDIYSLGILLYEMLTGRVPFHSESEYELMRSQCDDAPPPPREFVSSIPLPIEQAIMRALAKNPEARFQSAGELRAALLGTPAGAAAPAQTFAAPVGGSPPVGGALPAGGAASAGVAFASPAASPSGEQAAKETRLAAAQSVKETRLPGGGGFQPVPAQSSWQMPQPPPQQSASLFARLNWKHYTAAAVLVLIVLSAPFVLFAMLKGQTPPTEPPKRERPSRQDASALPPDTSEPAAIQGAGPSGGSGSTQSPLLGPTPAAGPQLGDPAIESPNKSKAAKAPVATPKKDTAAKDSAAEAAAREKARRREAAERALDK